MRDASLGQEAEIHFLSFSATGTDMSPWPLACGTPVLENGLKERPAQSPVPDDLRI